MFPEWKIKLRKRRWPDPAFLQIFTKDFFCIIQYKDQTGADMTRGLVRKLSIFSTQDNDASTHSSHTRSSVLCQIHQNQLCSLVFLTPNLHKYWCTLCINWLAATHSGWWSRIASWMATWTAGWLLVSDELVWEVQKMPFCRDLNMQPLQRRLVTMATCAALLWAKTCRQCQSSMCRLEWVDRKATAS